MAVLWAMCFVTCWNIPSNIFKNVASFLELNGPNRWLSNMQKAWKASTLYAIVGQTLLAKHKSQSQSLKSQTTHCKSDDTNI